MSARNIGLSSLVLVFVVLIITIFAVLSLSSAAGELSESRRYAESVRAFYAADADALDWVRAGNTGSMTFPIDEGRYLQIVISDEQVILGWTVEHTALAEPEDTLPVWDGES